MPFCGYCGRTLSYGEVCGCRSKTGETPSGDPEKAPGFHSYFCGYCGNKVEAGKICSCPKAQFEARFVRTRPRPQQYIEHRTPPERTAPPTAQPQRFHTPPPLNSSSTERTAPPTAQPQRFYTPPPLNSSSTERPTAPYRPAGTSFAQPPQDRTNGYPLPPHYVPYSPAASRKKRSVLVPLLSVATVILFAALFTVLLNFKPSKSSDSKKDSGFVQEDSTTTKKSKTSAAVTTEPATEKSTEDTTGKPQHIILPGDEFPESYSLVDDKLIRNHIEDQGTYGSCFAFSWIGIFENRLRAQGIDVDLSEWAFFKSFKENYYNANRTNDIASLANLLSAVVYEDEAPYPEDESEYDVDDNIEKDSAYIISDVYLLTEGSKEEVKNRAKSYLYNGYALICSVYYDDGEQKYTNSRNGAWYVNDIPNKNKLALNHSVLLVGWDDNYSKDNFLTPPPGDGAWLVKNSWGVFTGDYGYYWLSYYDEMFKNSELAAADITDADICDTKQGYWYYGWDYSYYNAHSNTAIDGKPMDKVYQACIYTAEEDMDITAVSFFTVCDEMKYRVYISTKEDENIYYDAPDSNGVEGACGYHMVEISDPKHVKKGEEYTVIVYLESPEKDYIIVQDSERAYDKPNAVPAKVGTCYVSADGNDWIDVKSYSLKNILNKSSIMPLCINVYGKT